MQPQTATDPPLFLTASLSRMARLCRELGVRDEAIHAQVDAACRRSLAQATLAPVQHAGALLQAGALLSGRDDFGLRLGARHHPGDLGTAGFLLLAASTAGVMIEALDRHGRLIQDRAFGVVAEAGGVELYYTAPVDDPEQRRQDAEFSIACIVAAVRAAVGSRLAPLEVSFEHAAPADTTQHRALFGCPVRFGRPANRVVLGRSIRQMPIVTADAALFDQLGIYVESGFGAGLETAELVGIVGGVIAALLPSGEASLDAVARRLDLSPRTLQRKLAQAGAGFGELLDSARRELARRYVMGTRLSMAHIAQLLGYSESAAFTRSYQRWHQVPPRRHRQKT